MKLTVAPLAEMDLHRVVAGLDVVHGLHRDDVHLGPLSNEDSLEEPALRPGRVRQFLQESRPALHRSLDMRQGFTQPLGGERLEKIIHDVDLERSQRMLVVRRYEDYRDIPLDQFEHLEAVQLGHLDIQQQEIRLLLADRLDRIETVGALGHHNHVLAFTEQFPQQSAGRFLIVDDNHPQGRPRIRLFHLHLLFGGPATRSRHDSARPPGLLEGMRRRRTDRQGVASGCAVRSRFRAEAWRADRSGFPR